MLLSKVDAHRIAESLLCKVRDKDGDHLELGELTPGVYSLAIEPRLGQVLGLG